MSSENKYNIPNNESISLPNKLSLTDLKEIELVEAQGFVDASVILSHELKANTLFDLAYIYKAHQLALGHIYDFAGKLRTVNMSKGGFTFPAANHLHNSMLEFESGILSNLKDEYKHQSDLILDIARVHGELLFIHPFRDGNGRTARLLANLMAYKANRGRLKFEILDSDEMFKKYIAAVQKVGVLDYQPMVNLISLIW